MVKCNTSNVDLSVRFRYATLIKYNNYENYIRNKAEDEGSIPLPSLQYWVSGNDGELRETVNLMPFGLVGSNPTWPTIPSAAE